MRGGPIALLVLLLGWQTSDLRGLEIDASLSGYNLLWPSLRCCAFTLHIDPDGHGTALVSVSTRTGPIDRQQRIALSSAQMLALERSVAAARFFDLPTNVGVSPIDGDLRKILIRRGTLSHQVEIGEWTAETATGSSEMRRADSVWQAIRSIVDIDSGKGR